MRLVWSLGLEGLQRETMAGERGEEEGKHLLLLSFSVFRPLFSFFIFSFFSFFPLMLWEWGGLSLFLFGLPPRHPSFTRSCIGLLPISQQCSHCRCGQDYRDPSVPVLSSHRQQMSRFLREHASPCWPLAASATK